MVSHNSIMRDMGSFHEEIAVTDDGFTARMRCAVNDYILSNDVIVANDEFTLLPTEVEILRYSSKHRALMHLIVIAHLCTIEHTCEGKEHTIVANHYVVFNVDKRKYLAVVTNLCLWRHFCSWTYIT